jgi:hypothetical protein
MVSYPTSCTATIWCSQKLQITIELADLKKIGVTFSFIINTFSFSQYDYDDQTWLMFNFNEPTLTTRGEHSIMDSLTDQNGSVFMKADKTRPLKIDQLNLKFLKF